MRTADDSIFSLLLLLITFFWSRRQHHAVEAFSANPPPSSTGSSSSSSRQFIELQDLTASSSSSSSSLPSQQLPVSFVEQWPTWVLDTSGVWSKIPDSSDGDADDDDAAAAAAAGFVQPTSVDTMFQPIDLKTPTHFQLALGFHVRQGTIRHVMPALDISFEGGQHRNRGLCSVPRAYKWIDFSNGMFGGWKDFEMRALVRKQQQQQQKDCGGDDDDDDDDDDGAEEWEEITSSTRPCGGDIIAKAIERTIFSLAQSPPAELEEGSHLVHVLLTDEEADDNEVDSSSPYCLPYPKTGHEICVVLDDRQKGDIPIQNLQVEGQGILHVTTFATMAGSESEFLPDAYKPLFHDKTLRNPLYERYKERRQQEKQ